MIEIQKIKDYLIEKKYNEKYINIYINYIIKESSDTKNFFYKNLTNDIITEYYEKVVLWGSEEDIISHITINSRGLSPDYIAYKNMMLRKYPESKIDVQVVYKDDIFKVAKESGEVVYSHTITNPFIRNEIDIIGAYCVIKNQRGEFLTILNREEIEKHKKIASTKVIWDGWFVEMVYKTMLKKGVKVHYADIFSSIEEEDNKNYDLEKLEIKDEMLDVSIEIEQIRTYKELSEYYDKNKDIVKDKAIFNKMIKDKKLLLTPKKDENL